MPPVLDFSPATWTLLATGLVLVALVGWALLRGGGGREAPGAAPRRRRRDVDGRSRAGGAARGSDGRAAAALGGAAPREPGGVLIELAGVTREYVDADGQRVVGLAPSDLVVHEGELLGVIGPSGLGKSTLLNVLGGIDVPTRGELRVRGRPLPREDGEEIRRYRSEQVAFVFQDLNLVTHLSAEDNAALPLVCRGVALAQARARARVHLERLGVGALAARKPAHLSGGQKQRVAIARAFTSDAPLILADEPTGSLDPHTAVDVMDAFVELARREGRTVVLVTHATALARRYCDRIVTCTADGLIAVARESGAAADRARPAARPRAVGNGAPP